MTCSRQSPPDASWKAPQDVGEGVFYVKKTRFMEKKMIGAVKQMEADRSTKEVPCEVGVSGQMPHNWRAKYGGMEVNEASG
jgi:putative transposase